MASVELLPCPFCGRIPRLSSGWTVDRDGWAVITCHIGLSDSCATMQAERSTKSTAENDVAKMWNRRAIGKEIRLEGDTLYFEGLGTFKRVKS